MQIDSIRRHPDKEPTGAHSVEYEQVIASEYLQIQDLPAEAPV
jgi:hypothetical protein